jgi:hypothetical protein
MWAGLTARAAYNKKRLADIQGLASEDANTQFQAQDKQVQYETVSAQLVAAKAAQQSAKLSTGFRDRRHQHYGRANSGATRERKMGIVADVHSRIGRRLCHRRGLDCQRPGVEGALGDVLHCREGDRA